jgi:hypothetical protein
MYIFYGKWNENHEFGTGFIMHNIIVSSVKRVEFVSDRVAIRKDIKMSAKDSLGYYELRSINHGSMKDAQNY